MPRFFLTGGSTVAGGTAFIVGEDAAHAKVLRLQIGERVVVCDGFGKDHHCTVTKVAPDRVEAEIFETVPCKAEPTVRAVVLCGLPKGDKTDTIVQKCTEAGASEIFFFLSKRCIAKMPADREKKLNRWQRIAEEAEFSFDGYQVVRREFFSHKFDPTMTIKGNSITFNNEPFEAELAGIMGLNLCSMGPRIFRCETAPVAALSAVMYATGNM